jgi:methionine-rich copper-binding protein CopC
MTGTGTARRPAGRWLPVALSAAILAAALVAILQPQRQGSAPVTLTGSDPVDNARLGSVPGTVTLRFSGTTQLASAHVLVEDAHGATVSDGDAEISGSRVSQPLNADGEGLFQVGFHVVSSSGVESAGVLRFTVGRSPASGPAPPAPEAAVGHVHVTKDLLSLVLVLVDLVLVVVLLIAMLGRRPAVRR